MDRPMLYNEYISEHNDVIRSLTEHEQAIAKIVHLIKQCFSQKCKLMLCGNGGSAADAQHMAAEFVNRFKKERRALPAIALTTDSSNITSICNDKNFKYVFSRQIEALAKPGDVLIAFSTSGNSDNIIEAINRCNSKQVTSIAFLGKDGGKTKDQADIQVIINSQNTPRIQEAHQLLYHIICEEVDTE